MADRGTSARCPICHGRLPTREEGPERGPRYAPLCSLRCKRIDLATWLGEGYRVPAEPAGEGWSDEPEERDRE